MNTTTDSPVTEQQLEDFPQRYQQLRQRMASVIVGQEQLIDDLMMTLLAGGHSLLEGMPGVGKTHIVKAISRCVGAPMNRIQCTPDLMPSDITGSEVMLIKDGSVERQLDFKPGPIFSSVVLVDEVNRATPKTQSALLEAMQEYQVTYGGQTYPLSKPFWLLATQNPIDQEGTYPLPEAQLDRFMTKLLVPLPDAQALLQITDVSLDQEPADQLEEVLTLVKFQELMKMGQQIYIAEAIKRAAVALILNTQENADEGHAIAKQHFRYGSSPRGLQALLKCARIKAIADGRAHVSLDDLQSVAMPTLRHRVILTMASEIKGIKIDNVLSELINDWHKQQKSLC